MSARILAISFALLISGCSTGPYLHPEAVTGALRSANRTCPGALEARWYGVKDPAPFSGVVAAVIHAKLPGTPEWDPATESIISAVDTKLVIKFWLYPNRAKPFWALSTEAKGKARKAYDEQQRAAEGPAVISVSSPYIVLVSSYGERRKIQINIQGSFDANSQENKAISVSLSNGKIDNFLVIFPEFFVNGEGFNISPVNFRIKEDTYVPVMNC
ncbi:hypothetical protein [Pseudomonas sp. BN411]|uniref:hypothetical protein n=1 Tax=Pseudomonas sp. BN411 TaxID=2567887 RepID=UPI002456E9B9|nr:hypothetical protein [Pseudomonas sp. BN411]MDH4563189.1 hypothetical protein [Pseudomonas sp. BN411]